MGSQDFEDFVDGVVGQAAAEADGDDAVELVVGRGRGLEAGNVAEVVVRGLACFAPGDARHHLDRAVADAGVGQADQRAVVALQQQTQFGIMAPSARCSF